MRQSPLHGLYVILDPGALGERSLVDSLKAAADGGATLFQYRDKAASGREAYHRATDLRRAASDTGARLLINDRCDLALAVDADGVHLGQDDLPLSLARTIMGPEKIIGISTHSSEQVMEATRQGADYLGFGPIFPTETKSDHEPVVGIDGLAHIRASTHLPIFAIGGITLETVGVVTRAGADGVAVISAIARASDLAGAVRTLISRLESSSRPGSG